MPVGFRRCIISPSWLLSPWGRTCARNPTPCAASRQVPTSWSSGARQQRIALHDHGALQNTYLTLTGQSHADLATRQRRWRAPVPPAHDPPRPPAARIASLASWATRSGAQRSERRRSSQSRHRPRAGPRHLQICGCVSAAWHRALPPLQRCCHQAMHCRPCVPRHQAAGPPARATAPTPTAHRPAVGPYGFCGIRDRLRQTVRSCCTLPEAAAAATARYSWPIAAWGGFAQVQVWRSGEPAAQHTPWANRGIRQGAMGAQRPGTTAAPIHSTKHDLPFWPRLSPIF